MAFSFAQKYYEAEINRGSLKPSVSFDVAQTSARAAAK
jgi:hypothetical protein